jgi:hypothetical protein
MAKNIEFLRTEMKTTIKNPTKRLKAVYYCPNNGLLYYKTGNNFAQCSDIYRSLEKLRCSYFPTLSNRDIILKRIYRKSVDSNAQQLNAAAILNTAKELMIAELRTQRNLHKLSWKNSAKIVREIYVPKLNRRFIAPSQTEIRKIKTGDRLSVVCNESIIYGTVISKSGVYMRVKLETALTDGIPYSHEVLCHVNNVVAVNPKG